MSDWTRCLKAYLGRRLVLASLVRNVALQVLCTSCQTGMTRQNTSVPFTRPLENVRLLSAAVPELTPRGDVKLNSGNRLHVTISPLGFAVAGHSAQVRHALRSRRAELPRSMARRQGAFEMDKQKDDLIYQIATAGLVVAFFVLMLFLRR
jgi:hypothetical protein